MIAVMYNNIPERDNQEDNSRKMGEVDHLIFSLKDIYSLP